MLGNFNKLELKENILRWLKEDTPFGDVTTQNIVIDNQTSSGRLIAKEDGVICGLEVVQMVFDSIDSNESNVNCVFNCQEGEFVKQGSVIGVIHGDLRTILIGERLALNLLQRMSGIASLSRKYADQVKHLDVKIVDTRKTTPGLRSLEKYAVKIGGCHNHRYSLSDAVMIKDNHIAAAGNIAMAVKMVRDNIPHTMKIEVEVETLEELNEALQANTDIIMLDNMDIETMTQAVDLAKGKAILEASGNMTLDRILDVAMTGVDIISVGSLTHSVKALDISLKFDK